MLYNILSNRKAVNALKDIVSKGTYLPRNNYGGISALENAGLVYADQEMVIASSKGKEFIRLLDEMKSLLKGKQSSPKLEVSLTAPEKDILLFVAYHNHEVVLDTLVKYFRGKKIVGSKKKLIDALHSLEELQLIAFEDSTIHITDLGLRTIRDDLMQSFKLDSPQSAS